MTLLLVITARKRCSPTKRSSRKYGVINEEINGQDVSTSKKSSFNKFEVQIGVKNIDIHISHATYFIVLFVLAIAYWLTNRQTYFVFY